MDTVDQLRSALAGRYEIERELGRGGMATVYLARDVRHQRNVALKVLLPELAAVIGPDRFLSEIRVTANLQHPNLLPLFDSGEADGLLYYVMPYVEGESLRTRLDREKQLSIAEALRLGTAIASALDYAHRHGVVHRDLKPENILLQDGQPVVADFGIALAVSNAGGARITQTGLSLGTPQYMSPEQATGDRAVDGRADIYSLGAMMYEMLTGDPPHTGSSVQSIIAKVLTDKPRSMRVVRETVPQQVDDAVLTALNKLAADRWGTASEFAQAMNGTIATGSAHPVPTAAQREGSTTLRPFRYGFRRRELLLGALLLAVSADAAYQHRAVRSFEGRPSVRFGLAFAPGKRMVATPGSTGAISPDGRLFAYVGEFGGFRQIYVRPLDDLTPKLIPGTAGATAPFFSPDSKWIGFMHADGTMRKVPVAGGPPTMLGVARRRTGVSWARGDVIVIGNSEDAPGLHTMPAGGGVLTILTTPDTTRGEYVHANPLALPDGKNVLFASIGRAGPASSRIAIASLANGSHTVLDVAGVYPVGMIDSWLTYVRQDGALMAVPIDLARRRVTGDAVALEEGITVGNVSAFLSSNGTLAYVKGTATMSMLLVDRNGGVRTLLGDLKTYSNPRYSPDGKRVAVSIGTAPTSDVWIYDLASRTLTRLTSVGNNDRAEWTPDSKRIVFRSDRDNVTTLWWQPADGSGAAEKLIIFKGSVQEGVVTPDGRRIVFRTDAIGTARDIWVMELDSARTQTPLLNSTFEELTPRVSPDGKWLAYVSDETGIFEVFLKSLAPGGPRWQVSDGGGSEPLWSHDGRTIYYRNVASTYAATVSTSPGVAVLKREKLFEGPYSAYSLHPNYDITPDGKEFLMLRPADTETVQVIVVLDWVKEARRKLQAARRN